MAVTSTVPARESRVNEFAEHRAFFVLMAVVCALIVGAASGKGLFLMGGPASPSGPSPFSYEQVRPAPALAVRIVFVTVDPERDTPAFLRDYMRYIPAGYVRLTGSAAQVSDGCGPVGRAL